MRATRSVYTRPVAHTVVATTWVRNLRKKNLQISSLYVHLDVSHQDLFHQIISNVRSPSCKRRSVAKSTILRIFVRSAACCTRGPPGFQRRGNVNHWQAKGGGVISPRRFAELSLAEEGGGGWMPEAHAAEQDYQGLQFWTERSQRFSRSSVLCPPASW